MDQIEVIDTRGEVTFYKLDPEVGVSTIGRNPNAEIPLPGADVANVHAMLYHRDAACQLVLYAENAAQTTLNSSPVMPNLSCTLSDGDTIQIGSYLLVYFRDGWDEAHSTETKFTVTPLAVAMPALETEGESDDYRDDLAPAPPTPSEPARLVHRWIKARLLEEDVVVRAGDKATFTLELTYAVANDAPQNARLKAKWLRENGMALNGVFDAGEIKNLALKQGETRAIDLPIDLKRVTPGRYLLHVHISSDDYSIGEIDLLKARLWVHPRDISDTATPANLQVQLMEAEVTADMSLPAVFNATVINSGPKEAQCLISIEPAFPFKLNPNESEAESWAKAKWHKGWEVEHTKTLNLHNGEARTLEIRLNLAQARDMVAGVYPFKVMVRSSAYPRSSCMAIGRLVVQPKTAFDVRDEQLTSTPLKVTFHKRQNATKFVIHNQSNRRASFVVNAIDRAGAFDFKFADDSLKAADTLSPAQFDIGPNETKTLTFKAQLREEARRFIAPVWHTHDVALMTTMLVEPPLAPKQSLAQVKSKPFWLVWEAMAVLAAVAGVLMGIAVLVSWPGYADKLSIAKRPSNVVTSQGTRITPSMSMTTVAISAVEETAVITWEPQTFSDWRWRLVAQSENNSPQLLQPDASGQMYSDKPLITTIYVLSPSNRLTTWLVNQENPGGWLNVFQTITYTRQVTASVAQPLPNVEISATTPYVYFGNPAFITWTQQGRTLSLTLDTNGDSVVLPAEDIANTRSRTVPFEKLTKPINTLKFFAGNEFKQKVESNSISVAVVPRINDFTVVPETALSGDKVHVAWDVSSRGQITLALPSGVTPSGDQLKDPKGELDLTIGKDVTGVLTLKLITLTGADNSIFDLVPSPELVRPISITVRPQPVKLEQQMCSQVFFNPPSPIQAGSPEAGKLRLQWDIPIDATALQSDTLEISGPGIGTLPVVGNKGDIPVPVTQSAVYVFKVVRAGVQSLVCPKELTVLPPPPTATPLPPAPIIKFFSVRAAKTEEAANVTLDLPGSTNGSPLYTVIAGTRLAFSWEVDVPVEIVKFNNTPVPNPASYELLPTGTDELPYVLEALKAGQHATRTIRIHIKERVPPAPFGLRLSGDPGKWTLTWSYPDIALNQIRGFRIKRSLSNGNDLTQVASENALKPDILAWDLTPGELVNGAYRCDLYYYVVAVYTDANGDAAESSSPSDGSVYTGACANSTPVVTVTPVLPPDLQSASAPSLDTPTPIP